LRERESRYSATIRAEKNAHAYLPLPLLAADVGCCAALGLDFAAASGPSFLVGTRITVRIIRALDCRDIRKIYRVVFIKFWH
jgi:hypothetical protein